MSQTQSQVGLLGGGPGLCRQVQPQTHPSWDCSRHICDVPPSYCHRPNPSWDCFEGDAAYAGEYSHRPIPAGIALVTFVTFPRTMSQTQSQLGLLRGGPGLCRWIQPQTNPSWDCSRHICDVPTSYCHRPNPSWDCFEGDTAYAGKYSHRPIPAGIASRVTRLMPASTATDQSQLGLLE